MLDQKITCGKHSFKLDELETAVKFAFVTELALKIENVIAASGTSDGLCFGDLQDRGLLKKRYIPGNGPDYDPSGIEWTVVGDVEFTTECGNTFKKGDVIEWEK